MSRVELPLAPETLDWIALIAFIGLFPVVYIMYRHFQSIRRRYPSDGAIGIGGVKTKAS
jgi:hypothetical protein